MAAHGIQDLQTRYHYTYFSQDEIYRERPQIIVLTEVLPDSTNTHLRAYVDKVVDSINGKKIRLLQDVHDALHGDHAEEGYEEFHVVRLVGEGRPLVLKRKESAIAHERIMAKYNVGFDHFIEEPEILELEGILDAPEDEEGKPKESEEKPEKPAKLEQEVKKAA